MTPRDFAKKFIFVWEDGSSTNPSVTHSMDPVDNGNWTGGKQGVGALVGSNHGVTAAALGLHRHIPAGSVTKDMMRALTIDEAADIALDSFFFNVNLDDLVWDRVTASVFDFGWGAGPVRSIQILQRLLGLGDDGKIGPKTIAAYKAWIDKVGEEAAAKQFAAARIAYYNQIIANRPANAKYLKGWTNRTNYYLPGTAWWNSFGAVAPVRTNKFAAVQKLNVRQAMNTTSNVLTVLNTGQQVSVITDLGDWSLIEYQPGQRGYVLDQYLKAA